MESNAKFCNGVVHFLVLQIVTIKFRFLSVSISSFRSGSAWTRNHFEICFILWKNCNPNVDLLAKTKIFICHDFSIIVYTDRLSWTLKPKSDIWPLRDFLRIAWVRTHNNQNVMYYHKTCEVLTLYDQLNSIDTTIHTDN